MLIKFNTLIKKKLDLTLKLEILLSYLLVGQSKPGEVNDYL